MRGILAVVCVFSASAWAQQDAAQLPMAPSAVIAAAPISFAAGVDVQRAFPGAMPLGLDQAIDLGMKHNLQILLNLQTERSVHAQTLVVGNALLPDLRATAYTNTLELNLAAMGFKSASLSKLGIPAGQFSEIVKVDTTSAQLSLNQQLFNVPAYFLYRAAQKAASVASLGTLNTRGGVVTAVGSQYLAAIADAAQIANARALVKADDEVLRQATLSHDAGVGTNLDVLRARVQLQNEQQVLVRDETTFAKDKIALTRLIGLPADQDITLIDTVPYAEFAAMPLDQARETAYQRRKDLLGLEAQLEVADRSRKAVRSERVPTLAVNGFYGVLGETEGLYHGVFAAEGTLRIPIFEEARFRGEREAAEAQQIALRHQIESLKISIDEQIRASMLDVQSSAELVKVARSNVVLAQQELSDTTDRFTSGVDDNLPVVQAQAVLADAQTRLIGTEFQYNQAKLLLARNTGVVETRYKEYLGR
jgi:outer membrane protein TolC